MRSVHAHWLVAAAAEKTRLVRGDHRPRVAFVAETCLYGEAIAGALPRYDITVVDRTDDPDVVLVDMTGSGGLGTLRDLAAARPKPRLLAVGVRDVHDDVVRCVEAGAIGYVARDASLAELAEAVHAALRGETTASPHVIATLMQRVASLSANRRGGVVAELTSRELEVVELIERGLSNKEIAAQLSIAVTTVKNHVHNILEKLDVQRRGEAASLLRSGQPR
jgi:two-component system, NarL family, nitrate/nitrite response regulator NarL